MVRKMPLDIQDVFDLLAEDIKQNDAAEKNCILPKSHRIGNQVSNYGKICKSVIFLNSPQNFIFMTEKSFHKIFKNYCLRNKIVLCCVRF